MVAFLAAIWEIADFMRNLPDHSYRQGFKLSICGCGTVVWHNHFPVLAAMNGLLAWRQLTMAALKEVGVDVAIASIICQGFFFFFENLLTGSTPLI